MIRVLVAGDKPWASPAFDQWHPPGVVRRLVTTTDSLVAVADAWRPDWVVFPHWSKRIPASVYDRFPTILFHMTDLPHGRGGSPLQNLILRGHKDTQLSAIRVVAEMDAGPVYMKRPLSLDGPAELIYRRATELAFSMATQIITRDLEPVAQGDADRVESFTRRTPEQSALPPASREQMYDFIRMLDAPGYPLAFVQWAGGRITFRRASILGGRLTAIAEFEE